MNTPPDSPRMLDRRRLLWWAFWFVFLGTPPCILATLSAVGRLHLNLPDALETVALGAALISPVAGAFLAGLLLALLNGKSRRDVTEKACGFGLAILALYLLLAFTGLSVVVNFTSIN